MLEPFWGAPERDGTLSSLDYIYSGFKFQEDVGPCVAEAANLPLPSYPAMVTGYGDNDLGVIVNQTAQI